MSEFDNFQFEEDEVNESENEEKQNLLEQERLRHKETENKIRLVLTKYLPHNETFLSLCLARLYISYDPSQDYEYTNWDGLLSVVINRTTSVLSIRMYDTLDFQKQFEIELYTNIESGYTKISDTFHCIEYPSFSLGINFNDTVSAIEVRNVILWNSTILDANTKQFSYADNEKPTPQNIEYFINIDKTEKWISFSIDRENNNEIIYEVSKGANKWLEYIGSNISEWNNEYDIIKDKIRNKSHREEENEDKEWYEKKAQEKAIEKEKVDLMWNILNNLDSHKEQDEVDRIRKLNKVKKEIFEQGITWTPSRR